MIEEAAAVVAALLVLRRRQESGESGVEPPDVIAARARVLEKVAEMRARLEQHHPERIARVAALTPDERRQMVEDLKADLARCVRGTRARA